MKKFTCVGLSMVLALGLLAGCGGNDASTSEPDGSTPDASTSTPADASTTELSGSVATDGSIHLHGVCHRRAGRAVHGRSPRRVCYL